MVVHPPVSKVRKLKVAKLRQMKGRPICGEEFEKVRAKGHTWVQSARRELPSVQYTGSNPLRKDSRASDSQEVDWLKGLTDSESLLVGADESNPPRTYHAEVNRG
jgi:hypothetical protein